MCVRCVCMHVCVRAFVHVYVCACVRACVCVCVNHHCSLLPAGASGVVLVVLSFLLSIKVIFNFGKGLKAKCRWRESSGGWLHTDNSGMGCLYNIIIRGETLPKVKNRQLHLLKAPLDAPVAD